MICINPSGADGQGEDTVGAKLIMVIDVLVALHEAEEALDESMLEVVFAATGTW